MNFAIYLVESRYVAAFKYTVCDFAKKVFYNPFKE